MKWIVSDTRYLLLQLHKMELTLQLVEHAIITVCHPQTRRTFRDPKTSETITGAWSNVHVINRSKLHYTISTYEAS